MRKKQLSVPILEGITGGFSKKGFLGRSTLAHGGAREGWGRLAYFKVFLTLLVLVLFIRLFYLTVIRGSANRQLAEENRIRYQEVEAARGKILDRYGNILAESREHFFQEIDGESREVTGAQARDLEAAGLAGENFLGELGMIRREVVREYPYGQIFSHVLGYLSRVQEEDLLKNRDLSSIDLVGRLGVEEIYDPVLRGKNGARVVEVDASEGILSLLAAVDGDPGADLEVTLDLALSQKVYSALTAALMRTSAQAGAVVVSRVDTGEILTLASAPAFDPNNVGQAVVDARGPLFNRAITGVYTPGSVFKIVTAVAGLASGKITPETEIEDVGEFSIGDSRFSNWYFLSYGGRDGILKIDRAIARSNDIFFYRLGERLGLSDLRKWAVAFGFGQAAGIDLPSEASGLVGDELWKIANRGESWFLGDTMHLAIGQGFILATPIQVNMATATVANGGRKVTPYVVRRVRQDDGRVVDINARSAVLPLSQSTLAPVKEGMKLACSRGGTAWPFFNASYAVGCKTGTAERAQGNPHAWFTAFAPYQSPEIAITVIIENGGEGSAVAAPVAKEVLDWYFSKGGK